MKVMFENIDVSDRVIVITNKAFAFPARMPIIPGHVLVCPRRIVKNWEELYGDEIEEILRLMSDLKIALKKAFGAEGFNIAWNEGRLAGQTVDHLHIHLVPRSPNDKGIVEYEPRSFLYRPGSRANSPDRELQLVAKKITQYLPQQKQKNKI